MVSCFLNMYSTPHTSRKAAFPKICGGKGEGIKITYFKSCCCRLDKLDQTNILSLNEKFLDMPVILWLHPYIF